MKQFLASLFVALLVVLTFSLSVSAAPVPISYEIGPYSEGGFSASFVHTAESGKMYRNGKVWYTAGDKLGSITGTLDGALDGDTLLFHASTLSILDIAGPLGAYDLEILGGKIKLGDPAGGFLKYSITDGIDTFSEGTFVFPFADFGAPNRFDETELVLWGQNFIQKAGHRYNYNGYRCKDDFIELGIDLYGFNEPVPTPEPATLAMMGIGLGAIGVARRRKRRDPENVPTDDEVTEAIDER